MEAASFTEAKGCSHYNRKQSHKCISLLMRPCNNKERVIVLLHVFTPANSAPILKSIFFLGLDDHSLQLFVIFLFFFAKHRNAPVFWPLERRIPPKYRVKLRHTLEKLANLTQLRMSICHKAHANFWGMQAFRVRAYVLDIHFIPFLLFNLSQNDKIEIDNCTARQRSNTLTSRLLLNFLTATAPLMCT